MVYIYMDTANSYPSQGQPYITSNTLHPNTTGYCWCRDGSFRCAGGRGITARTYSQPIPGPRNRAEAKAEINSILMSPSTPRPTASYYVWSFSGPSGPTHRSRGVYLGGGCNASTCRANGIDSAGLTRGGPYYGCNFSPFFPRCSTLSRCGPGKVLDPSKSNLECSASPCRASADTNTCCMTPPPCPTPPGVAPKRIYIRPESDINFFDQNRDGLIGYWEMRGGFTGWAHPSLTPQPRHRRVVWDGHRDINSMGLLIPGMNWNLDNSIRDIYNRYDSNNDNNIDSSEWSYILAESNQCFPSPQPINWNQLSNNTIVSGVPGPSPACLCPREMRAAASRERLAVIRNTQITAASSDISNVPRPTQIRTASWPAPSNAPPDVPPQNVGAPCNHKQTHFTSTHLPPALPTPDGCACRSGWTGVACERRIRTNGPGHREYTETIHTPECPKSHPWWSDGGTKCCSVPPGLSVVGKNKKIDTSGLNVINDNTLIKHLATMASVPDKKILNSYDRMLYNCPSGHLIKDAHLHAGLLGDNRTTTQFMAGGVLNPVSAAHLERRHKINCPGGKICKDNRSYMNDTGLYGCNYNSAPVVLTRCPKSIIITNNSPPHGIGTGIGPSVGSGYCPKQIGKCTDDNGSLLDMKYKSEPISSSQMTEQTCKQECDRLSNCVGFSFGNVGSNKRCEIYGKNMHQGCTSSPCNGWSGVEGERNHYKITTSVSGGTSPTGKNFIMANLSQIRCSAKESHAAAIATSQDRLHKLRDAAVAGGQRWPVSKESFTKCTISHEDFELGGSARLGNISARPPYTIVGTGTNRRVSVTLGTGLNNWNQQRCRNCNNIDLLNDEALSQFSNRPVVPHNKLIKKQPFHHSAPCMWDPGNWLYGDNRDPNTGVPRLNRDPATNQEILTSGPGKNWMNICAHTNPGSWRYTSDDPTYQNKRNLPECVPGKSSSQHPGGRCVSYVKPKNCRALYDYYRAKYPSNLSHPLSPMCSDHKSPDRFTCILNGGYMRQTSWMPAGWNNRPDGLCDLLPRGCIGNAMVGMENLCNSNRPGSRLSNIASNINTIGSNLKGDSGTVFNGLMEDYAPQSGNPVPPPDSPGMGDRLSWLHSMWSTNHGNATTQVGANAGGIMGTMGSAVSTLADQYTSH